MKRKNKHLPTYTHERTSFAGISERLALASLAFSKTWVTGFGNFSGARGRVDMYMHSVRYISKKEGWEARFNWSDGIDHINIDNMKAHIALSIECARAAWYENQHPSKELLSIVAHAAAKKAA